MTVFKIRSLVKTIEEDILLYNEHNFEARAEAKELIDTLLADLPLEELQELKYHIEKIKTELEAVDSRLFEKLRDDIRSGECKGDKFKDMLNEYLDLDKYIYEAEDRVGYDNLDIFINSLLSVKPMPEPTEELEPEMVFYQKTPARLVFMLAEKMKINKDDVFVDLGSGLGQVVVLINLLTGVEGKGVEFEPSLCKYAANSATELNIMGVQFLNIDARKADHTDGTIFFMFTPFEGEMLKEVLARLKWQTFNKTIRIITYGPCTRQVRAQNWLAAIGTNWNEFGFFSS